MKIEFTKFKNILTRIFMLIIFLFCALCITGLSIYFISYCHGCFTSPYIIRCNEHTYFAETYEINDDYICFFEGDDYVRCPKDITEIIQN
jgi:hypothetical protein